MICYLDIKILNFINFINFNRYYNNVYIDKLQKSLNDFHFINVKYIKFSMLVWI